MERDVRNSEYATEKGYKNSRRKRTGTKSGINQKLVGNRMHAIKKLVKRTAVYSLHHKANDFD